MTIYDYRRLTDPTEAELNALGSQGYHYVDSYLDPKATFSQVVIMEKSSAKPLTENEHLQMMADIAARYIGPIESTDKPKGRR